MKPCKAWMIRASFAALPLALVACSSSNDKPTSADSGVKDVTSADTNHHEDAKGSGTGSGSGTGHKDAAVTDAKADTGIADAASDVFEFSCNGLTYCDGFESYEAGTVANGAMLGPWVADVSRTVMTVDSRNPYSGNKSLHITIAAIPDASASGTLEQKSAAGLIAGDNLYGRAMVFYATTADAGLPIGVHSWLFNASGTSSEDDGGVTMNLGGGGAELQLNYHPPAPAPEQSVQGGMVTTGAWHCIQWQYDGAGTPPADIANLWIDGTLAVTIPLSKGWKFATPWSAFEFGFTHYQTLHNAVDVFLDDFALDSKMLPCP